MHSISVIVSIAGLNLVLKEFITRWICWSFTCAQLKKWCKSGSWGSCLFIPLLVFTCSMLSWICTERLQVFSQSLDYSWLTNQKPFPGASEKYGERTQLLYKFQVAEQSKQQLIPFTGKKFLRVPELLNSKLLASSVVHGFLTYSEGVLYFLNLLDSLGNFTLSFRLPYYQV